MTAILKTTSGVVWLRGIVGDLPFSPVGGVGGTYSPGGVIYNAFPATTTLASTNFAFTEFTPLPAGLLSSNGDEVIIRFVMTSNSTTGSKTYQVNAGYTSVAADATGFTGGTNIVTSASTTASVTWTGEAHLVRTGASTQLQWGLASVGGSWQVTAYSTATITDTAAIKVGMAIKDAGGNAGAITIRQVSMEFKPGP